MAQKTMTFKTEVRQLLDLVIHSLYSKKEIFLRELISNASDAVDRAQLESLTDKTLIEDDPHWSIRVALDRKNRTLTVSDNGIGMNMEEVEANIGTIASSGTRRFLEALRSGGKAVSAELIGQFGVGFYSTFMVADKVTILTRRAGPGQAAVRWESAGAGEYTVEEGEREGRGTDVTLHLKPDMDEFLDEWRIRQVVTHYSDYIAVPVVLAILPGDKPGEKLKEETVNSRKAIWRRPRAEVTAEEHTQFYRHISHDRSDPIRTIHYAAEGATEYRALLYVPRDAPPDFLFRGERHGVHLYVKNVFIMDDCKELLPPYLRFVRGVVDSSDLPLNVSREILQDDAIVRRIRKSLVGRVLGALAEMQKDNPDDYRHFFGEFGRILKEGIHFDPENADRITDLLLYRSTATTDGKPVTLKQYTERMPAGQKDIYYIAAETPEMAAASPHLEAARARGIEVLYFTDPVDEWILPRMPEYAGKKLHAVNRGDMDLLTESERTAASEQREAAERELHDLMDILRSHLQDEVKTVRVSDRLTESACCLVADEEAPDPHVERLLRAMNQDVPKTRKILEINPGHPAIRAMQALAQADRKDARLKDYADLLYDQGLIGAGALPRDPLRFTKLVSGLMTGGGRG